MATKTLMRCAQFSEYGPIPNVLSVTTRTIPKIQSPDQVLVKVAAAGLNPLDYKVILGHMKLLQKAVFPATPGFDFSGSITEIGANVTRFSAGDQVYGRLSSFYQGTLAEYVIVSCSSDAIELKPKDLTHVQAASLGTTGVTVAAIVNSAEIKPSTKVLVLNASGGVATTLIPVLKHLGAEVTGVCSTKNINYVTSLKADSVIDYTKSNLDDVLAKDYDVIVDCVGGEEYWNLAQKVLKRNGVFITTVGSNKYGSELSLHAVLGLFGSIFWKRLTNSRKYIMIMELPSQNFRQLHNWVCKGVVKPAFETTFSLEKINDAFELLMMHRTVGKIVITM